MRLLFFLVFLSCTSMMNATVTFQTTYGGPGLDAARYVIETSDYGYAMVGGKSDTGGYIQSAFLIRTNKYGDTLWTRLFDWAGSTNGWCIQETSDGGFILSCSSSSSLANGTLIKTDALGDTLWTKQFDVGFISIRQTNDGGYIAVASMYSQVYLLKLDNAGLVSWSYIYVGNLYELAYAVQQTSDGGYIVCGATDSWGAGDDDYFLMKTDSLGNHQWSKAYGGSFEDRAMDVIQTSDGGYIMIGNSYSFSFMNFSTDMYVVRTDSLGNLVWAKIYGESSYDYGHSVRQTADGGFILCGYSQSFGTNSWLIRTDANGVGIWSKIYGPAQGVCSGYCVQITHDQGFVLCGLSSGFGDSEGDAYLIKTDSLGNSNCFESVPVVQSGTRIPFVNVCTPSMSSYLSMLSSPLTVLRGMTVTPVCLTVSVDEKDPLTPNLPAYPNPFDVSTTILFDNLHGEPHTLIVYDAQGREVKRIGNIVSDRIEIQREGLKSGIYFFTISAHTFIKGNGTMLVQ